MAPRRKRELATEQREQVNGTAETPPAKQSPLDALKERLAFMEATQKLIRETMTRRDIDHDNKKGLIVDGLMQQGVPDDEIGYILTKKPGQDGNEYYGFTFREMGNVRDQIRTQELIANKRAGFAARETARRSEQNEAHLG
jgi:hypothetical protein